MGQSGLYASRFQLVLQHHAEIEAQTISEKDARIHVGFDCRRQFTWVNIIG